MNALPAVSPLENIGFYTLEDQRAANVSMQSPLWRCELILTDLCNFKCPYCRGIEAQHARSLTWQEASFVVRMWASQGLKNIRFSGGEPTLWKGYNDHGDGTSSRKSLRDLVALAKELGVKNIAVSSNGSVANKVYRDLLDAGVTDFSISLDACTAPTGDKMAGNIPGAWQRVVDNIRDLAALTYVTVGVVFTPENEQEFLNIVKFASDYLNVADIRILTSAQWNSMLAKIKFDQSYLDKHPIFRYRMTNFGNNRHVRGIKPDDCTQCPLMLDDMAILNGYHYPCIIYMREQGRPVGKINQDLAPAQAMAQVREDRLAWVTHTNTHEDPICKKNCLDVCIDYNNRVKKLNVGLTDVLKAPSNCRKVIQITPE